MPRSCPTAAFHDTADPCRVCGADVVVIRSDREPTRDLVDHLRVCTSPRCLSNGGREGAGRAV